MLERACRRRGECVALLVVKSVHFAPVARDVVAVVQSDLIRSAVLLLVRSTDVKFDVEWVRVYS